MVSLRAINKMKTLYNLKRICKHDVLISCSEHLNPSYYFVNSPKLRANNIFAIGAGAVPVESVSILVLKNRVIINKNLIPFANAQDRFIGLPFTIIFYTYNILFLIIGLLNKLLFVLHNVRSI